MLVSKQNVVLAVIVLGLAAADWMTMPTAIQEREVQRLFPAMKASLARRLVVTDPERKEPLVITQAEAEELERAPDAWWRLPALHGWPAFDTPMRSMLRWVDNLSTLDLLASDADSHGDYGLLDGQGIRIQIYDGQGEVLADFYQGLMAPGGRATYVRAVGEDEVWRAPGVRGRLRADPRIWMETTWLPLTRAEVVVNTIELSGAGFAEGLRLERSEASVALWRRPDGELVPSSAVRALFDELDALVVDEISANAVDAQLLAAPRLAVRLERSTGEAWTAYFGEAGSAGKTPATRGAQDWLVTFPESAVARVVESAQRLRGK